MDKLKKYIDRHGVGVLAKKSGLNKSTIHRHLTGIRGISASAAMAYHKATGIPLEELLSSSGN